MASSEAADRLSQISTLWTDLVRAHGTGEDDERRRLAEILERYQSAVYRYLAAASGDPDLGVELFQEFALRFLRGDFRQVDPTRGRFRDYLRASLINLVRRGRAAAARQPSGNAPDLDQLPAADVDADAADDQLFLAEWRKSLLERAWKKLLDVEQSGGPPYHSVLKLRADRPDTPSAELAAQLADRLARPERFTDSGIRKLLQRGREELSDVLVEEVAASIPTRDRERLTAELIDLGFYGICRAAMSRWRG